MAYPPNTGNFDHVRYPIREQLPNTIFPIQPLERALNFPGAPIQTNPRLIPQPPYQHSQATMDMWDAMQGQHPQPWPNPPIPRLGPENPPVEDPPFPPVMQDLPGISNVPNQGMPRLPSLQSQFNNPGNMAMPAGSMQSPFPGGNQPMARPSGRPKLPDPPQPPRQQQGTPPQRGPFGQPFGERQY